MTGANDLHLACADAPKARTAEENPLSVELQEKVEASTQFFFRKGGSEATTLRIGTRTQRVSAFADIFGQINTHIVNTCLYIS